MSPSRQAKSAWTQVSIAMTFGAALLAALISIGTAFAAAPAGSLIRNQASATYRDGTGVQRFTTSNVVETVVRQVASIELAQNQSKLASAGGSVTFPHVLTNTGNGADSFALVPIQLGGDDYDFVGVSLYADADQNGIADSSTAITSSPVLSSGDSFSFVIRASIPVGLPQTNVGDISIAATSNFDSTISDTNADRAVITGGALIDVSKSMNVTQGRSPSGPFTITLSYRNSGTALATEVTLIDALPLGMSYVPNSAHWSETDVLVLSDANPQVVQGSNPNYIRYCAYNGSCTGLPEAVQDNDTLSVNQVTAVIAQVAAGAGGTLSFNVSIDAGVLASDLFNAAEFEYNASGLTTDRVQTNTVAFRVAQAVAVIANGSTLSSVDGAAEPVNITSAFQGSTVAFDNIIWNIGNDTDTIDVAIDSASSTFPAGTAYQLFREDGATPLVDSSGNGIPDTGPLAPNTSFKVVLRVMLPTDAIGNNGGAGYQVSKTARSTTNPGISNNVIDHLDDIVPSTVDLTNNEAAGTAGALGENMGPEASALVNNAIHPGGTTRFTLYVTNTGNTADELLFSTSTDSSFVTETLPAGWTINFRNEDDSANTTSTGTVVPATTVRVYADVTVPANQPSLVQGLYFRVQSPTTNAVDIIHDAVTVDSTETLLLEPASNAQIEAGGAFVYSHRIQNNSNTAIGPITFTTTDSLVANGWSSQTYADSDGDGNFTAADAILTSIASLPAGDTRVLFVKVFSPTTAASSAFDVTTLTASWDNGSRSMLLEDVTTITAGDIVITKEQAPDFGCTGTLDGPYTQQPFAVEPGNNCVRYRLVATNAGVEPVFNAVIADATPAFTVYQPAATCSVSACTISEPAAGSTGAVSGEVASVAPGESVEFTFAVLIE